METPEVIEDHYEKILDLSESKNNRLNGFISIHNTNLGPALGGTRIFPYKTKKDALIDAMRLSKSMTYKCAISGLPFGGGKGVIIANPKSKNIYKILEHYAKQEKKLKGKFYTGEDVGMTEAAVQYMFNFSPYFIGKTGQAGDPSGYAAESAYYSIKWTWAHFMGKEPLSNKSIKIKGVGKTGAILAKLLMPEGLKIYVTDIDKKAVKDLIKQHPQIKPLTAGEFEKKRTDILAPCALGNEVTHKNINKIKSEFIIGTANNQLEDKDIAELLFQQGIVNVPDYIANAGGLIDVADELLPGGYNKKRVAKNIQNLKKVLLKVFEISAKEKRNPNNVADYLAEQIFIKPKKVKHV